MASLVRTPVVMSPVGHRLSKTSPEAEKNVHHPIRPYYLTIQFTLPRTRDPAGIIAVPYHMYGTIGRGGWGMEPAARAPTHRATQVSVVVTHRHRRIRLKMTTQPNPFTLSPSARLCFISAA